MKKNRDPAQNMECREKEFEVLVDGTTSSQEIEQAKEYIKSVLDRERFQIALTSINEIGKKLKLKHDVHDMSGFTDK